MSVNNPFADSVAPLATCRVCEKPEHETYDELMACLKALNEGGPRSQASSGGRGAYGSVATAERGRQPT